LVMLVRHQRDPMSPGAQPDAQAHERENVTISAYRYEDSMHRGQASPHSFRSHVAILGNRRRRFVPQHEGQASVIRPVQRAIVTLQSVAVLFGLRMSRVVPTCRMIALKPGKS